MVYYFNMSDGSVCYAIIAIVAIAVVIYGFVLILGKQTASENDTQVIQRQIRGFAFILLAQVVLVLGAALCMGMGYSLREVVRAARM